VGKASTVPVIGWVLRKDAIANLGHGLGDRNLPPGPTVGRGVRRAMLALVVAIAASCQSGPAPVPTQIPTPGSPSAAPGAGGWVTIRDEDAGFSVSYPATWHRATTTLTPSCPTRSRSWLSGPTPCARVHQRIASSTRSTPSRT
jgi:hypothetical protein